MAPMVIYRGADWQRGYGIAGIFSSAVRNAAPILKDVAKKALQNIAKRGLKTGIGLAGDALRGKDMSKALQMRIADAISPESQTKKKPKKKPAKRPRKTGNKGSPARKKAKLPNDVFS